MAKRKTMWEAADGQLFEDKNDAEHYDRECVAFAIRDKLLARKIYVMLDDLERTIDYVAETAIRHPMNEHVVTCRRWLKYGSGNLL